MYLLGFNCFKHDASATLIRDGEIVAAAEEERFNGLKHTFQFPKAAIEYCLETAEIGIGDVDYVCYYFRPNEFLLSRVVPGLLRSWSDIGNPMLRGVAKSYYLFQTVKSRFFSQFPVKGSRPQFVFVDHHLAHAASACYPSGFAEAAVMIVDGSGERETLTLYNWKGRQFTPLRQINYPYSLGLFYSAITDYLGFEPNNDEYKVMGLAPYGRPKYVDQLRQLVWSTGDGGFTMDLTFFDYHRNTMPLGRWVSRKFIDMFGPPRVSGETMSDHYADLAASAQVLLEEILLDIARWLRRTTGMEFLTVAGGVGLNCVANARLLRDAGFTDVFFQPAAADMGASLGAALYQYHSVLGKDGAVPLRHLYFGPEYTTDEIEHVLRTSKVRYSRPADLEGDLAARIADGKIAGWFQGRMEFGPRALGARSILADPRRAEMKDVLNAAVKFREEFRPFAPSVALEEAGRFFQIDRPSPYMILTHTVRPEARDLIPAVTHVDGTARVHTVDQTVNPRYYRLLRKFEAVSGIPLLINTSFNVKGQPVVRTPEEALRTFFSTGLDVLAIGDFLVEK